MSECSQLSGLHKSTFGVRNSRFREKHRVEVDSLKILDGAGSLVLERARPPFSWDETTAQDLRFSLVLGEELLNSYNVYCASVITRVCASEGNKGSEWVQNVEQ